MRHYVVSGRIQAHWIDPTFYFSYFGFDWVRPWPGDGMYLHVLALWAITVCIMLGVMYRLAMALFCVGYTYLFLLDATLYNNHHYLICLLALLLACVPGHRACSLHVLLRPERWTNTAPMWMVWLLRVQIGIVYFYGGLAKLQSDWLHGFPIRLWLSERTGLPLVGTWLATESAVFFFTYGGLFFDLLIVPFLLWRRTRVLAFSVAVGFHVINSLMYNLGVFPWLMIGFTAIFFPMNWVQPRTLSLSMAGLAASPQPVAGPLSLRQRVTLGLLVSYLAIQFTVPLRHHVHPSNRLWTNQTFLFSWNMKVSYLDTLGAWFAVNPLSGVASRIDERRYLTNSQREFMNYNTYNTLQFSHYLAKQLRAQGQGGEVEIHVVLVRSLNGRKPELFIDPAVDLAAQPLTIGPYPWILPMTKPLRWKLSSGHELYHEMMTSLDSAVSDYLVSRPVSDSKPHQSRFE